MKIENPNEISPKSIPNQIDPNSKTATAETCAFNPFPKTTNTFYPTSS